MTSYVPSCVLFRQVAERSRISKKERDRLSIQPREVHEVDGINSAFPGLALGHEGLCAMERLRDLYLSQARIQPRFPQPTQHGLVARLVDPSNIPH